MDTRAVVVARTPRPTAWYPTEDGETHHWCPYHFIDVDDIGYGQALVNIAGIFCCPSPWGGCTSSSTGRLARAPR